MAATKKTTVKAVKTAPEATEEVIEKVEKKVEAEKAAEKKPVRKSTAKKAALSTKISVQFAGKSYTNEDLVKIAKDVWQYDLKREEKDLKSVDLYVKPEESTVYYVFNGTEEGSFGI